jgi:hypothetical protein
VKHPESLKARTAHAVKTAENKQMGWGERTISWHIVKKN